MKKILLAFSATAIAATSAFAQAIPNASFETWRLDTSVLDLSSLLPGTAPDTFTFQDPADWTSSNFITGAKLFRPIASIDTSVTPHDTTYVPQRIFVTESSDAHTGNSALSLKVDTVFLTALGQRMPIPGFAASGAFDISLTSFVSSDISLTNIPDAGVPVDGRKGKLKGFYKYTPTGAVGTDSCAAIAVLKKGTTIVATAEFYGAAATNGYVAFEAPFVYSSCEIPDTVVILLSASNPRALEGLMDGATQGLPLGSEVLFDDIELEDTAVGFQIPPIAVNDEVTTLKNTAATVTVTTNDQECYGNALTVSADATSAAGGTVAVSGNDVTYTPATDFLGADSFSYTITASTGTGTAKVYVTVNPAAGIRAVDFVHASVYPNPAQNVLNIDADAKQVAQAVITDIVGKVVAVKEITTDKTTISTENIQNGLYVISLSDANGRVRYASKFTVAK